MLIPGKGDIPGSDVIIPHFCGRTFRMRLRLERFCLCSSLSFLLMTRLARAVSVLSLADLGPFGEPEPLYLVVVE